MLLNPANLNSLTEKIVGAAITVHRFFGPGLLESVYRASVEAELRQIGLRFERERRIPLTYRGINLGSGYRADLIVDGSVLVEVKAVDALSAVHLAQVTTYLKLTGCPVGLLLNFNVLVLRHGLRRVLHPDFSRTA